MYKRILVPLDGSELAECALGHVRAIAESGGVDEVVLLSVYDPPFQAGGVKSYIAAEHVIEAEERLEADARGALNRAADKLRKEGITVRAELIIGTDAAAEILKFAEANKTDLIIISTHGRSGVSGWVFGSVADRVVHRSNVPVLMVVPHSCRRV